MNIAFASAVLGLIPFTKQVKLSPISQYWYFSKKKILLSSAALSHSLSLKENKWGAFRLIPLQRAANNATDTGTVERSLVNLIKCIEDTGIINLHHI